jgi:hypothetical protein
MMPADVELHIEELVLHGFAPGDHHRLGEAVQRELARLLAEQGVPPGLAQGGEMERLDGGGFRIEATGKPEAIGAGVAQAVYGGLNR